jgi:hypothetical protein
MMKRVALIAGVVLGLFLTGRAIAEPFVVHWGDQASYRNSWGGPSLAGVLAVHMLPGLILPVFVVRSLRRQAGVSRG